MHRNNDIKMLKVQEVQELFEGEQQGIRLRLTRAIHKPSFKYIVQSSSLYKEIDFNETLAGFITKHYHL